MIIAIALVVLVLVVSVMWLSLYAKDLRTRLKHAGAELKDAAYQSERRTKGAVASSRTSHVGRIVEQLAPLLPGFPDYNLKDVQWIGGTTDFIVWEGLEDATCRGIPTDAQIDIIFVDIKSGSAELSPRQRLIRDAVDGHRVYLKTHRFQAGDAASMESDKALESSDAPDLEGLERDDNEKIAIDQRNGIAKL